MSLRDEARELAKKYNEKLENPPPAVKTMVRGKILGAAEDGFLAVSIPADEWDECLIEAVAIWLESEGVRVRKRIDYEDGGYVWLDVDF